MVIHKVLDVDEVGLAQPLPLALDKAAFALQLMQQLSGLLVGAAQGGHDLLDGEDDKPRYCWCQKGIRPSVPCHHIREYRYVYGAVEPLTGDGYFLVMPDCNTVCMNIFLKKWVSKKLSEQYSDDIILLCCDGAAWHKSGGLELPENIIRFHIPPYTPEMNPIEQIWKEIRKRGFRNEVFATLEKVVDRLCDTICSLSNNVISSITGRDWIIKVLCLSA